jgi:hypothetical protein
MSDGWQANPVEVTTPCEWFKRLLASVRRRHALAFFSERLLDPLIDDDVVSDAVLGLYCFDWPSSGEYQARGFKRLQFARFISSN